MYGIKADNDISGRNGLNTNYNEFGSKEIID
jgi:hypothetical protein